MNDVGSDDDFSLNPGARAGGVAFSEENDDAPAIRAALHFSVGEICSAEEGKLPMTGGAVSTLAEVGMQYTYHRCKGEVEAEWFECGMPRSIFQIFKKAACDGR